MNKAFLTASLLGLLCSGVAVPVVAGDTADTISVAVKYGDLNLQSAKGQQALKRRLRLAARTVCPDVTSRHQETRSAGKRCVNQTVGQAMADVSERQIANASAVGGDRS